MASIRHKARSIAELARIHMSPFAYKLLLIFMWLTMVYVLVVFIDLNAATFSKEPAIASSSDLFILLAIAFGYALYKFKVKLLWASLIFVPLIFVAVFAGQYIPFSITFMNSKKDCRLK